MVPTHVCCGIKKIERSRNQPYILLKSFLTSHDGASAYLEPHLCCAVVYEAAESRIRPRVGTLALRLLTTIAIG